MTGFIVDEGCLYAVLKGTDGYSQLYDKQALTWIISEARKEKHQGAKLRKRSSDTDHSQHLLANPTGTSAPKKTTQTGIRFPSWAVVCSQILLGDTL